MESVVSCQLSVVCCLLSVVGWRLAESAKAVKSGEAVESGKSGVLVYRVSFVVYCLLLV